MEKCYVGCILKCRKFKVLLRFPPNEKLFKIWLDRIGFKSLPCSYAEARLCNNHFSQSMLPDGGRPAFCAVPDINLPPKPVSNPEMGYPFYGKNKVKSPYPAPTNVNLEEIPRIRFKTKVITSPDSSCLLKCKNAQTLYPLPDDKGSLAIWLKQLGLNQKPRNSPAQICQNHFSVGMYAAEGGTELAAWSVPDINLPGQTEFIEEAVNKSLNLTQSSDNADINLDIVKDVVAVPESMANALQGEEEIHELFRAVMDPPPSVVPSGNKIIGRPEVLINTIENIKSAVNSTTCKEGILHVFQPGVEGKADDMEDQNRVILPEGIVDPESECVLKCPHGERLFKFPSNEAHRRFWLKKIGLTHCFFNTRICERHFSPKMFVKSGKRLTNLAFPDINLPPPPTPRIQDPNKSLKNYRMVLPNNRQYDVVELPQYICVLTILKRHTEVDAVVNGIKYIHHKVDKNVPKREREIQVNAADLIRTASVAVSSDDCVDDIDFKENSKREQMDWIDTFKSHVLASNADMYECLICGEITVGFACNLKHTNIHKESSVLCFQCGQLFPNQYMLTVHERDIHFSGPNKVLHCPKKYCNMAFVSRKVLHLHIDAHVKQILQYKCNRCLRQFASLLRLHTHRITCKSRLGSKYSKKYYKK